MRENSMKNPEKTAESSRKGNHSDIDSLKQYYKHLSGSEPLTPEAERVLWDQVDAATDRIRDILYTFTFVQLEHINTLRSPSALTLLPDFFPPSTFPETESDRDMAALTLKLQDWLQELEDLSKKLKRAYNGKKSTLAAHRKKAVELLKQYPASREKLQEWYDVARVFRKSYLSSGDDLFVETHMTLAEKLSMDAEEFLEKLALLDREFEKLDALRQQVVTCNLRLVVSLAQHYHGNSIQLSDMIQEGNLGLLRAIDKFDYKLGHRFATYAAWWVKQALSRAIANQSRVIRLPAHMIASIVRIGKAEQDFLQRNGHLPTDQELSALLELPRERISAIKKMACQTISLQAPTADYTEKDLLENLLCDTNAVDPTQQMTSRRLMENLKKAISNLPEREQQIIRLRYGLDGCKPKTLIELSTLFNLTRERIRQIEQRAIRRLRNPNLEICYQDYFFDH